VTAAAIFGIAIAAGALAALWPYLFAAPSRWPADPPGPRALSQGLLVVP